MVVPAFTIIWLGQAYRFWGVPSDPSHRIGEGPGIGEASYQINRRPKRTSPHSSQDKYGCAKAAGAMARRQIRILDNRGDHNVKTTQNKLDVITSRWESREALRGVYASSINCLPGVQENVT